MRKYLLLLIPFITCSCSRDVTGIYIPVTSNLIPDKLELEIKNDSTFLERAQLDVGGDHQFEGQWQIKKNILVLTESVKQRAKANKSFLKKGIDDSLDSLKLFRVINYNDSFAIPGAVIFINGTDTAVTNLKGEVKTNINEISKIRVSSIGIKDTTFLIGAKDKANRFDLFMSVTEPERLLIPLPIRKWLIKKNKLIPLNSEGSLMKNNTYIKQKAK